MEAEGQCSEASWKVPTFRSKAHRSQVKGTQNLHKRCEGVRGEHHRVCCKVKVGLASWACDQRICAGSCPQEGRTLGV